MLATEQTKGLGRWMAAGVSTLLAGAVSPALAGQDTPAVAVLEIEGSPAEMESSFTWLGDGNQTLLGIVQTLDTLAVDDEFSGVLLRLKDAALGYTQIEEIGAAIRRVREAGKRVGWRPRSPRSGCSRARRP